jgi:hypothetical protein
LVWIAETGGESILRIKGYDRVSPFFVILASKLYVNFEYPPGKSLKSSISTASAPGHWSSR